MGAGLPEVNARGGGHAGDDEGDPGEVVPDGHLSKDEQSDHSGGRR
jgi:hypothetical protein